MNYLEIDGFGKYLVVRKKNINKNEFFSAIKCKNVNGSDLLQDNLYNLLCLNGSSIDNLFKAYCASCTKPALTYSEFISLHFSINLSIVNQFLSSKRDDEECYYVDNVLINGYGETFLLGSDRLDEDEISTFQKAFREAIRKL